MTTTIPAYAATSATEPLTRTTIERRDVGLGALDERTDDVEPVVVGGSAIEFYTDGAYMSGDTDICWTGWPQPDNDQRREIMLQIPGVKSAQVDITWEPTWTPEKMSEAAKLKLNLPYDEN